MPESNLTWGPSLSDVRRKGIVTTGPSDFSLPEPSTEPSLVGSYFDPDSFVSDIDTPASSYPQTPIDPSLGFPTYDGFENIVSAT